MRNLRNLKNLTQINISELLGISRNAYSKIERDQTDIAYSRLEKVASVLETSVVDLLCFGDDKTSFMQKKIIKLELEISYLKEIVEVLRK